MTPCRVCLLRDADTCYDVCLMRSAYAIDTTRRDFYDADAFCALICRCHALAFIFMRLYACRAMLRAFNVD